MLVLQICGQIAWTLLLSESPYCLAFDPSRSIHITIAVWETLKVLCCAAKTIIWLLFSSMFPVQTWHPAAYLFPLLHKGLFVLDPNIRPYVLALLLFCLQNIGKSWKKDASMPILTINKEACLMHVAKCCRKVKVMVYIQRVLNGRQWRKMLFVVIWCSYNIYQ